MAIPVKYVGNKLVFQDHLADTGLAWEPGQTHLVPEAAAVKLLAFPTFQDMRNEQDPIEVPEVKEKEETERDEPPLVSLETMTKDQLLQYAQRYFGVELDGSMKKAELVDAVRLQQGKRSR